MITQAKLREHFLNLGKGGALYVWGANGEIITKESIDALYKKYGSTKYTRSYYDKKLAEGEGKVGADCSGSLCPVSGYDTTAKGYYNRCVEKGDIYRIPTEKVCLVFKKNSKGINHVGCYTGDGYVSEMASSKLNYQRKPLKDGGWDLWGMPDFISNPTEAYKGALDVDGVWGKGTTKKSQEVFGTTIDGKISNQKISHKAHLPKASSSSWKFALVPKKGSALIRAIQNKLKSDGFYSGEIHGWCDKPTVTAMQKFLAKIGLYTANIDGKMGGGTVRAWQTYINSLC